MCAREVDAFLTGLGGTQLPTSGGIVKKLPYDMVIKMNQQEQAAAA
jgi:hypothetical protein